MLRFLAGLLPTRRAEAQRVAARIPDGQRVYAIGDIHGRSDLLTTLLAKIKADTLGYKGQITLVFIGDYIDRGPDSKGVIDIILKGLPESWRRVCLRGNHEQAMLNYLENPKRNGEWLAWGGMQALESYGVPAYGPRGLRDVDAIAAEVREALKDAGHSIFFNTLKLYEQIGDYLFVHAGVRPGVALEKQMEADFLFIREDWMHRPHYLPYRVVFGHTILPVPLVMDDRIGIDTGAFQTDLLTAVRLEGERVEIIQTADHI